MTSVNETLFTDQVITSVAGTFLSPEALRHAVATMQERGYKDLETFTPHPVEGIDELLESKKSPMAAYALFGGIGGGLGAWWLQYYTSFDWYYPIRSGNRPFNSWQSFVPVTFELTILAAACAIFTGFFLVTGLPRLFHPIFSLSNSERITNDGYVLEVKTRDPNQNLARAKDLLRSLGAIEVQDVLA